MIQVRIRTHETGNVYVKPHRFFLSRGNNVGKPLPNGGPNAFVVETKTETDADAMAWVISGLWYSGAFNQYLIGSVIPFIHIKNFSKIINNCLLKLSAKPDSLQKIQAAHEAIDKLQKACLQMTDMLEHYKKVSFHSILNRAS
jgi:hypothetical protein